MPAGWKMWLLMSLWKTKEKITKKVKLLSSNTLNMIQIKLLMEFKVIFFSRSTVEGDESFQIGQFLLIQNRKKAIPTLPDSCPVLTAIVWTAHRGKSWAMMKMASTDITTSLVKGQKSQPRSLGLTSHQMAGFKSSHLMMWIFYILNF